MISITSSQLNTWLALFIFPFVRILALVASAPILGNRQVPARVKIGFSIMLTMIIAPTLTLEPGIEPGSAIGLFILLQQLLAGLAMGFAMRLIFTGVEMAGEIAGLQMGLGFATFYDPLHASYAPIVAQFFGILAALTFLSFDGHLQLMAALAESFQTFPISSMAPSAAGLHTLAVSGGNIFAYALQLSLPLLGAMLITNLALGILTRAAPQLNLFSVGFPITLVIGFAVLALALPYFAPLLERFISTGLNTVLQAIQQLANNGVDR